MRWNLMVNINGKENVLESYYNLKDAEFALHSRKTLWQHLGRDLKFSYRLLKKETRK